MWPKLVEIDRKIFKHVQTLTGRHTNNPIKTKRKLVKDTSLL